jgi:23S rRNA pseudouridine2605 synthase
VTRALRAGASPERIGAVPLARALSKLGLASRSEAIELILAGRVAVDGVVVSAPGAAVVPERVSIAIDGTRAATPARRTIALHKPRGVVTTRRDPEGRPTVYDLLADVGQSVSPVGRLDLASSGLLVCTNDTAFAAWLTDPASAVEREYVVTVRGRITDEIAATLERGIVDGGERLQPTQIAVLKASSRESHLRVVLSEGKNREIRRLMTAAGHEVTRLLRVRIGGLVLGDLAPRKWRDIQGEMLRAAFPGYSGRRSRHTWRLAPAFHRAPV